MQRRLNIAGALVVLANVTSTPAWLGCECSEPLEADGGIDTASDGGIDGGVPDELDGGVDAAQPDTGIGDGGVPQPHRLCPNGRTYGENLPRRCADEPIPGFRIRPDGWYHPCNCFERDEGGELRTVPTACHDQGLRTVPFDCSWPRGAIYHRAATSTGPIFIESDGTSCEPACDTVSVESFYEAPYHQAFVFDSSFSPPDPRLPVDRVCFPAECVFETPGEPARCSQECADFHPEWLYPGYATIYRVDRSACGDTDAGVLPDGGADGGVLVRPPISGLECL